MSELSSDPIPQLPRAPEPNLDPGLASSCSLTAPADSTGPAPSLSGSGSASVDWETILNQVYGRTIEATIQTGKQLINAKKELGYGAFGRLFASGGVKYSQRRAEMFIEIALCPVLTDPKNYSNLPGAWSVLHALSKIPYEALGALVANGEVGPETTLKQARTMVNKHRSPAVPASAPKHPRPFDADKRLNRLGDYLEKEAAQWPPDQFPDLAAALREFASRLVRHPA